MDQALAQGAAADRSASHTCRQKKRVGASVLQVAMAQEQAGSHRLGGRQLLLILATIAIQLSLPSELLTLDAANYPLSYGLSYRRLLVRAAGLSCLASRSRSRQTCGRRTQQVRSLIYQ